MACPGLQQFTTASHGGALRARFAYASRARRARFARGQTAKTSIFSAPAAGGEERVPRGKRTAWRDVVTVLILDQDGPRRNAAEQRHRRLCLFRLSAPQCVEGVPRDSRSGLRVTLLSNLFMGSLSVSVFKSVSLCHHFVRWCDKKRASGGGGSAPAILSPLASVPCGFAGRAHP